MPRRKNVVGTCHLCGNVEQLSFEHVPPRAAFNDRRVIRVPFEQAMELGPEEIVKGEIHQGGIGDHTLCIRCNNTTGGWYGKYFVDWCYQAMEILNRSGGNPSLIYMQYLFPLPILKEIVTMFFSVNPNSFSKLNPDLVRFVLNREAKNLPPKYRFFVYYNTAGKFRYWGVSGTMNIFTSQMTVMSEITFPPFGYLMTIDSKPPDNRLFEITHFSDCDYNEFKVMTLKLPVLPTHTMYPGDYRTKDEILREAGSNKSRD